MTFLERLNRILVACMLGLVVVQAGLLILLKSMRDQAEYRLVKNQTTHDLQCGRDQFSESHYWSVQDHNATAPVACADGDCQYSAMVWESASQDKELHIVSVQAPPPYQWNTNSPNEDQGGVVRVQVKKTEKPQVLALVSRSMLEWDIQLDVHARIEKVIVASPVTVWLKGLPPDVPIEYVPKEKMCSYPWTWEEVYNPDNDFRTLLKGLRTISGVQETSFQGAKIGRQFTVPSLAQGRDVASVAKPSLVSRSRLSEQWVRGQGKINSVVLGVEPSESLNTMSTRWVTQTKSGLIFSVVKGALHLWSTEKNEFQRVWVPMKYSEAQNISALAYDVQNDVLWLYNNERSGELFRYQVENSQWTLAHDGLSKNIVALAVSPQQEIVALVRSSVYISELVVYNQTGQLQRTQELGRRIAIDTLRWQWQLHFVHEASAKSESLWLQLASVAQPAGDWYKIEPY